MGRNSHYWAQKTEMSKRAKEVVELARKRRADEIAQCIDGSVIYDSMDSKLECGNASGERHKIKRLVTNEGSVDAVLKADQRYKGQKLAVLNFASFKHPGGGFLKGSLAQEESLCHESIMYPILESFDKSFYSFNRVNLMQGLYMDRAIYIPNVWFGRVMYEAHADVITCAAPNLSVAKELCHLRDDVCVEAMRKRAQFIKDIAEANGVEVLVLGAYGCGVFKWDAEVVANIFKEVFAESSVIETVLHPVPAGVNKYNYNKFKQVFG